MKHLSIWILSHQVNTFIRIKNLLLLRHLTVIMHLHTSANISPDIIPDRTWTGSFPLFMILQSLIKSPLLGTHTPFRRTPTTIAKITPGRGEIRTSAPAKSTIARTSSIIAARTRSVQIPPEIRVCRSDNLWRRRWRVIPVHIRAAAHLRPRHIARILVSLILRRGWLRRHWG